MYVSVLLFYLVYDLHLFVLVTLSRTLLNLCCMICCLFVLFFLFSLSHDLIIIGIINNITSLYPIEGPNLHFILLFLHTLLEGFWISVFPSKWETWWTQPFCPPGGWDTMVNETGTKQWTKHPHKHTHTTTAHTDNQKIQNTPPALIEQFLALFIDNKLELLEFKGGLVQF